MTLTKQDLGQIQKIVNDTMDIKMEAANKKQTEQLAGIIEGIIDSVYGNHPTRGEVKKGLKAFSESITLKTS